MTSAAPTHAVKAVITDSHGSILFLQRNGAGRADMHSNWDLPGGVVEVGEDDHAALHREIAEELGAEVQTTGQKIGNWSFYRKYDGATVHVSNYRVALQKNSDFSLSDEHIAYRWVTIAELLQKQIAVKDPSIFSVLGIENAA